MLSSSAEIPRKPLSQTKLRLLGPRIRENTTLTVLVVPQKGESGRVFVRFGGLDLSS